jgi:23S rRNA pseudouridine1911/1915/1917 synthase
MTNNPSFILYQDDFILIANKPSGIPIHETKDPKRIDFTRMVQSSLGLSSIRTANRLDLLTTGIVVFGLDPTRNSEIDDLLNASNKYYLALVHGFLKIEQFRIETFLKDGNRKVQTVRSGGKKAITEFKVIAKDKNLNLTLVEAKLITGRRHQIRIHLAEYGFPIVGDPVYNLTNDSKSNLQKKIKMTENFKILLNSSFLKSLEIGPIDTETMYLHSYKLNFKNLQNLKSDSSNLLLKRYEDLEIISEPTWLSSKQS